MKNHSFFHSKEVNKHVDTGAIFHEIGLPELLGAAAEGNLQLKALETALRGR